MVKNQLPISLSIFVSKTPNHMSAFIMRLNVNMFHIFSSSPLPELCLEKCQGTSVISPVIPLLAVVLSAFIISQKSVDRVFETHPSLYIITFGMVAAKVTNKLVVSTLIYST